MEALYITIQLYFLDGATAFYRGSCAYSYGSTLRPKPEHPKGSYRKMIKKPWVFIRVPCMNPNIFGFLGPGFLN